MLCDVRSRLLASKPRIDMWGGLESRDMYFNHRVPTPHNLFTIIVQAVNFAASARVHQASKEVLQPPRSDVAQSSPSIIPSFRQ